MTGPAAPALQGVGSTEGGASTSRDRLIEAMTCVVAAHGYAGASVARVAAAAGASRATFYSHFRDRDDCFFAAYRRHLAALRAALTSAASPVAPADRPRALLAALLAAAAADPPAARLVLLEPLGASPSIRAAHQDLLAFLERSLADPSPLAPPLQLPASSLLGGLLGVVSAELLRDRAPSLPDRLDDLYAWACAHRIAPGESRYTEARWRRLGRGLATSRPRPRSDPHPPLLPRGRHALPPEWAAADRQERILTATIDLVAAKGFAASTVTDIVAASRVPRAAFYSHFRGKQDAYIAAQTASLQRTAAAAAHQFSLGRSWPERVWYGMAALLDYLAARPAEACLVVAEVHAAGHAALRRELENRSALTLFLEQGYRVRPLPPLCSEAIAAAIHASVRRYVVSDRAALLPELLPQCAYLCLAPFLGPRQAVRFVELRLAEARSGPRRAPRPAPLSAPR